MTTYVTIPNTDVDQDSPVTVALMTAYRDNVIAVTEGATGAPRNAHTLISDDDLAGVVSVDVALDETLYTSFMVEMIGINPPTNGPEFEARFSDDAGATFAVGTYDFMTAIFSNTDGQNSGVGKIYTQIGEGTWATDYTRVTTASAYNRLVPFGKIAGATQVDAVQFGLNTLGTFTSGRVRVWGLK